MRVDVKTYVTAAEPIYKMLEHGLHQVRARARVRRVPPVTSCQVRARAGVRRVPPLTSCAPGACACA
eukprot:314211-Prymnesium_polylepis.1